MHDSYILLYGVMLNSFIGLRAIGLVSYSVSHSWSWHIHGGTDERDGIKGTKCGENYW